MPSRRGCPAGRCGRCWPTWCRSGPTSTRSSATTGCRFLREPDLGFAWAAYRWAGGADLDDVLDDVDLAPGDFVRWVKQVLDLAEQIADAAGDTPLRRTAREVATSMRRGVVAYSAEVD